MRIENIVFEGGGAKIAASAGAVAALKDAGLLRDLRRVAGTSAGAIAAMLMAIGVPAGSLGAMLISTPFAEFFDGTYGVVRDLWRLFAQFGYYRGDAMEQWLGKKLHLYTDNENLTFRQLADLAQAPNGVCSNLYVTGVNLSRGELVVFSNENTPDMPIKTAVRISAGFPLVFSAKRYNDEWYVDGGILANYPIDLFDRDGEPNPHTVGIRVDTLDETEGRRKPIVGFRGYLTALVGTAVDNANRTYLSERDWRRTIYCVNETAVGTLDFDFTRQQAEALMLAGRRGVANFLEFRERERDDK